MFGKIALSIIALLAGIFLTSFILINTTLFSSSTDTILSPLSKTLGIKHKVIGFLPYWLLAKADKDYTKYITTLSYFSLTISPDGNIVKLTNPSEEDPGWNALKSHKVDPFFENAKKKNIELSLTVFSSDEDTISQLISDPVPHARNLINVVGPIMKEYGFKDLNLDIESVITASPEAQLMFTSFTRELKKNLHDQKLGTLTVDASPIVLVKDYLIDLDAIGKIADTIVLMTYDFHYTGSYVTGPVAPIGGVETNAEFDIKTALDKAITTLPLSKIILGVPLYGYSWETLSENPKSAVIPGTGITYSNRTAEDFIRKCASCSANIDKEALEPYIIYLDQDTNTYHQLFYPDKETVKEKIELTKQYKIAGLAFWALGYEGDTILTPLEGYK